MCGSTPPGITICPAASTTRTAPTGARVPGAPTAAILPSLTAMSAASAPFGNTAVPPVIIRSNMPPAPLQVPKAVIVHIRSRRGYAVAPRSASRALAKNRIGGFLLRRRQDCVQTFEHRQHFLQSSQLHLAVSYIRAQILDRRCIGRRLLRHACLGPRIFPHDIGDRVELCFLSGSDL